MKLEVDLEEKATVEVIEKKLMQNVPQKKKRQVNNNYCFIFHNNVFDFILKKSLAGKAVHTMSCSNKEA